ncbi:MAG: Hint domain-containing protein [Roseovarius sp.]|nr:Hint domain-containing protein [Roseovarius sp.]
MGWIALATRQGGRFAPGGLGVAGQGGVPEPEALMPRGTLMIETRPAIERRPLTLLEFGRSHPWQGRFALQLMPSGGITLIEDQAGDLRHATLPFSPDDRSESLRITYSWDAPARWGRLTLERPDTLGFTSVRLAPPRPMPLADLHTVFSDPRRRRMDPQVVFAALSDTVEPVGPMPGLGAQVPVRVPGGYVHAGRLRRGDCVYGSGGTSVPVLQAIVRTVPAAGSFAPVRLRAPYFGLRADIVVAPHQRLVIRGADVDYLFGCEAVLVPARHLVNGFAAVPAVPAETGPLVRYHGLILPEHEEIEAAGTTTESVYLGRMRRKPEAVAMSLLAGFDRARLPEHARPVWQVLRQFEAVTLAMARAA